MNGFLTVYLYLKINKTEENPITNDEVDNCDNLLKGIFKKKNVILSQIYYNVQENIMGTKNS